MKKKFSSGASMLIKAKLENLWFKSSGSTPQNGLYTELDYYLGVLERKIKKLKYQQKDETSFYLGLFDGLHAYFTKWSNYKEAAQIALQKRPELFHEALLAGREIQDKFKNQEEFFYLGMFIDLKVNEMWGQSSFWKMVYSALKSFTSNQIKMGKSLKQKILKKYKEFFPEEIERIGLALFQFDFLVTHINPSRTGSNVV